jgi:predicted RNA binding protein YcfA (HicA-like mRNA interferase family)
MKAREVERRMTELGCVLVRQRGSHRLWKSAAGDCVTTVASHAGEDVRDGTLRAIERQMEHCLGQGWLRRR